MPELNRSFADALSRVRKFVQQVPPGIPIDPTVLAISTDVDPLEVLASLRILQESNLGELQLRVVDPRGLELGRFKSIRDIPARITDNFGETTRILPENVELIFQPRLS